MRFSLPAFADELWKLAAKVPTGPSRDPFRDVEEKGEKDFYKGRKGQVLGTPEMRRRVSVYPSLEQAAQKPYIEKTRSLDLRPPKPAGS